MKAYDYYDKDNKLTATYFDHNIHPHLRDFGPQDGGQLKPRAATADEIKQAESGDADHSISPTYMGEPKAPAQQPSIAVHLVDAPKQDAIDPNNIPTGPATNMAKSGDGTDGSNASSAELTTPVNAAAVTDQLNDSDKNPPSMDGKSKFPRK